MSRRVLLTGATGFVGPRLARRLAAESWTVRAALRRPVPAEAWPEGVAEAAVVGSIGPATDWSTALADVDAVVHAAARVHVMRETAADPLAENRAINTQGTARLAEAAATAGVARMVFLSSVKVMGEASPPDRPWTEADAPAPVDAYGRSKWEGEQALARVGADSGLSWVALRAPLVYGPGVGGNMRALLGLCARPLPLPFAAVANRRSLIAVDNLADAVAHALTRPAPPSGVFFVSDGPPLSIGALVAMLRRGLGRRPALVSVPPALMRAAGRALGQAARLDRLTGDLAIDDSAFRSATGWRPPVDPGRALAETAAWYGETRARPNG